MRLLARWTRTAALIALTGGTLAMCAAPVAGAPAPISILSVSAEHVKPGDKVRVQYRVTNTGSRAQTAIVVVGGGLECTIGCRVEPTLKPGQSQDFQATVVAPQVDANTTLGVNISVGVRLDGEASFDFKFVYIYGPGAPLPGPGAPQPGGGTSRPGVSKPPSPAKTASSPANTPPSPTATAAADKASEPETSAAAAAPPALKAVSDEGSGSLPFTLGGLLAVAGLGALALMVNRRRNTPDEPAPHAAIQLTAPAGAGMSDAPTTVLHTRPTADGFPGPYSGPQQGGIQQFGHDPYGGPAL